MPYEELSRRIQGLPRTPLMREAPKRMSLAGAQHKMMAVLKGQDVYEPVGSTPSTHILEPDHPACDTYPASAYLEWLTMRLASAARLNTPPVELLHIPLPVYAIERFDRQFDRADFAPATAATPPAVQRVHVIDACQLLNKSRVLKYGAGVQVLRELSQACEDKLTTPVLLFRWLVSASGQAIGVADCRRRVVTCRSPRGSERRLPAISAPRNSLVALTLSQLSHYFVASRNYFGALRLRLATRRYSPPSAHSSR